MLTLTPHEIEQWLRIDIDEDNETLIYLLGESALSYLYDAVNVNKLDRKHHPKAKLLMLFLVSEWYEQRNMMGSRVGEKRRHIIESMVTQLQNSIDENGGVNDV